MVVNHWPIRIKTAIAIRRGDKKEEKIVSYQCILSRVVLDDEVIVTKGLHLFGLDSGEALLGLEVYVQFMIFEDSENTTNGLV